MALNPIAARPACRLENFRPPHSSHVLGREKLSEGDCRLTRAMTCCRACRTSRLASGTSLSDNVRLVAPTPTSPLKTAFWALLTLFGLASALKSAAERATSWYIRRNPGTGREPAPDTQAIFGELVKAWIDTGAH